MKTYTCQPDATRAFVVVGDKSAPLNPRFDLRRHSPDGFAYGYGGSGPAQFALAILADATGDAERAQRHYQDFKWDTVARAPRDKEFRITEEEVLAWVRKTETPT